MLAVTVNGHPLDAPAIIERGRVLVPMRATIDALGATVSYDARTGIITISSRVHDLSMRVNSRRARADGSSVMLEAPPERIAGRTYVPLRFVAQSMGATVAYDAKAQTIATASSEPAQSSAAQLTGMTPAPNSIVSSAYPTISAMLANGSPAPGSIRLLVDGTNVTTLATFTGATMTYMPRSPLAQGAHSVTISGTTAAGVPFSGHWTFESSGAAAPDAPAFGPGDYRFYTSGPSIYYPGDWMHFVLIAPSNGSAMLHLCGLGDFPLLNGGSGMMYTLSLPVPRDVWMPDCTVTAIYTAWNGAQTYVPVPITISLFTRPRVRATPRPAPTPRPVPTLRPVPVEPRRTEPPVQRPPERPVQHVPRPKRTPQP